MARTSAMDSLENKIEKAQVQVSRTKKQYDEAVSKLSDLLDKRDALRRDELVKAIMKSDKTYDEIMAFLSSTEEMPEDEKNEIKTNGKRGRKTKRAD